VEQLPPQVQPDIGERRTGKRSIERFEEIRLGHVDARERRRGHSAQIAGPVEAGRQRLQLCLRHLVINGFGIAPDFASGGIID